MTSRAIHPLGSTLPECTCHSRCYRITTTHLDCRRVCFCSSSRAGHRQEQHQPSRAARLGWFISVLDSVYLFFGFALAQLVSLVPPTHRAPTPAIVRPLSPQHYAPPSTEPCMSVANGGLRESSTPNGAVKGESGQKPGSGKGSLAVELQSSKAPSAVPEKPQDE